MNDSQPMTVASAETRSSCCRRVSCRRTGSIAHSSQPTRRAPRSGWPSSGAGSAVPAYAAENNEQPVTFINAFDVEPSTEETAFAAWQVFNDYMVSKPGYRSHTLHLRVGDAAFGLVNVVEWESVDAWQAAHDDGFRTIAARPQPFVSHPTLCRPVGVTAGDRS